MTLWNFTFNIKDWPQSRALGHPEFFMLQKKS